MPQSEWKERSAPLPHPNQQIGRLRPRKDNAPARGEFCLLLLLIRGLGGLITKFQPSHAQGQSGEGCLPQFPWNADGVPDLCSLSGQGCLGAEASFSASPHI